MRLIVNFAKYQRSFMNSQFHAGVWKSLPGMTAVPSETGAVGVEAQYSSGLWC